MPDDSAAISPLRILRLIMLGVLTLVSLAATGFGAYALLAAVGTWVTHDYLFSGWSMLDWFLGLVGAAIAGAGLMLLGMLLRFVGWKHAPLASLVLSIFSTLCILAIYAIFSQVPSGIYELDTMLLQIGCFLAVFLVPLPPFLHWYFVQRSKQ